MATLKESGQDLRTSTSLMPLTRDPGNWTASEKNILSPLTSSLSQALVSFFLTRDKEREVHSN